MRRYRALALILAAAIGLRLYAAARHEAAVPHEILGSLPFTYEAGNIAYSLSAGHGFASPFRQSTGPTAWLAPVYPWLLSWVLRASGGLGFAAYRRAVDLNILFSALTCIPIFLAGRRVGNATTGALAAALWAVLPNAVILPYGFVWDTTLSALCAATLLWATLALAMRPTPWRWALYGVFWGLVLLTNPALGMLLPLFAWLAVKAGEGRQRRRGVVVALAAMVLVCLPWTIRNWRELGGFTPIKSTLGLQLWVGNNDAYVTQPPNWLLPINDLRERRLYVRMGELPYVRGKMRMALEWMAHHPARLAALTWMRFVATWAATPTPWRSFRGAPGAIEKIVMASNWLTALGMLAGLGWMWRRRRREFLPLLLFPLLLPCPYYLTEALLRYRHAVDPALVVLCAVALWPRAVTHAARL